MLAKRIVHYNCQSVKSPVRTDYDCPTLNISKNP